MLITVVARLAGLGRGVLFAQWMNRSESGTWALAYGAIAVVSCVVVLGIHVGLRRYTERLRRAGCIRTFLLQASTSCLGGAALLCLMAMLFSAPPARWLRERDTLAEGVLA